MHLYFGPNGAIPYICNRPPPCIHKKCSELLLCGHTFYNELCKCPYPYAWPDAGELTAGGAFSLAWRCLDAQFWGVAQRRKRIFLLADFAGPLAPQLLFDVFGKTENCGKEVT